MIPTTEEEEFPVIVMVVVPGPKEVVLKRQAGQRTDAGRWQTAVSLPKKMGVQVIVTLGLFWWDSIWSEGLVDGEMGRIPAIKVAAFVGDREGGTERDGTRKEEADELKTIEVEGVDVLVKERVIDFEREKDVVGEGEIFIELETFKRENDGRGVKDGVSVGTWSIGAEIEKLRDVEALLEMELETDSEGDWVGWGDSDLEGVRDDVKLLDCDTEGGVWVAVKEAVAVRLSFGKRVPVTDFEADAGWDDDGVAVLVVDRDVVGSVVDDLEVVREREIDLEEEIEVWWDFDGLLEGLVDSANDLEIDLDALALFERDPETDVVEFMVVDTEFEDFGLKDEEIEMEREVVEKAEVVGLAVWEGAGEVEMVIDDEEENEILIEAVSERLFVAEAVLEGFGVWLPLEVDRGEWEEVALAVDDGTALWDPVIVLLDDIEGETLWEMDIEAVWVAVMEADAVIDAVAVAETEVDLDGETEALGVWVGVWEGVEEVDGEGEMQTTEIRKSEELQTWTPTKEKRRKEDPYQCRRLCCTMKEQGKKSCWNWGWWFWVEEAVDSEGKEEEFPSIGSC